MIDQTTFLKPDLASKYRNELEELGVPQLSYEDFLNNEVGLARKYLPAENIEEYQRCIEMVYKENSSIFYSCNLAVDGDLRFCRPSTLYDSSVSLFQAAFRDQKKSRFLHPELAMSHVWRDFLIKNISGPTYLECARSIERRNSQTILDDQMESDACDVFDHLCYDYHEMRSWYTWGSLREIRFAPIQEVDSSSSQSPLKSKRREEFRQQNKLVAISDAVDPKFEGISWAVKPVLRKQMGSLALQNITSEKPMVTPTTVIEHLEFLSSHREEIIENELPTRISEIKEAYEYLEGRIDTSTIPESALIWLNIENKDPGMTLEIFRNSWSCAGNLCLNIKYDSGEIKRVRSFLDHFRQLLIDANIPKVIPPERLDFEQLDSKRPPMIEGLLKLRERELLLDVTITTGKPTGLPQTFKAHKAALASISDYWKSMFTSEFMESSTAKIKLEDDPSTIKVLLDYIYTNEFVEPPHEDDVSGQLENLLDQLEKSDKWFLLSFKHSMENYLSDDHWIRPETVKFILKYSRTYNADRLARVCEKYIMNNKVIVEREGSRGE